jgi:hypothetical protein
MYKILENENNIKYKFENDSRGNDETWFKSYLVEIINNPSWYFNFNDFRDGHHMKQKKL